LITRTVGGEESLLRSYQMISPGPSHVYVFRNKGRFCGEELLAPRPTPKLKDHPLSAVRDYLFSAFAATLHTRGPFLHPQPEEAPRQWHGPNEYGSALASQVTTKRRLSKRKP
jgi:hypothetical protein